MVKSLKSLIHFLFFIGIFRLSAHSFERVQHDLAQFDQKLIADYKEFEINFPNIDPFNKNWVMAKINFSVKIDQWARLFWINHPKDNHYSMEEKNYFQQNFWPRLENIDTKNLKDLKEILFQGHWFWFSISVFGKTTSHNAWIIAQHADTDLKFQREILAKLEKLYPANEVDLEEYPFLYDRVAIAWRFPHESHPQRFGTQGSCTPDGKWTPGPIEDPQHVNERRAVFALKRLEDYITEASNFYCKNL